MNNSLLESLAVKLSICLKKRGYKLKIAESFTGGLIAAAIVQIDGASTFFSEGLVCYSNSSKIDRLKVSKTLIDSYGAVSCVCVLHMLKELINSGADIAIATSGNAGPTASSGRVGECFLGVKTKTSMVILKFIMNGTRTEVIYKGSIYALKAALDILQKE